MTATKLSLSVALAVAALGSTPASAFSIDTGNPDTTFRWDNTVRYSLGWRLEDRNPHFANAYGSDEVEANFKKHDLIVNRLDLLSEMDYIAKMENQLTYGARVSASLWSENAYPKTSMTGDKINATFGALAPTSNYGAGGQWSNYAKRFVTGSSGEFLDAFVFGGFQLGSTTLNVKLGQHNVYWGETLYSVADGISAGQQALDGIKGSTTPGAETKELFMPINQISAQWSLTPQWSLIGQYQLDWKPFRVAPAGTFFAGSDASGSQWGGDPMCASSTPGGGCVRNLDAVTPDTNGGSWGLGAKWVPAGTNDIYGFYYRKYDERLPWGVTQIGGAATNPANIGIRLAYARDTELLGMSLGTNAGSISVGMDLSYRRNTALNSNPRTVLLPLSQVPTYDQVEGPRGNTYHLVLNAITLLDKTALYETGGAQVELAYQRLDKVTVRPELFKGVGYACTTSRLNKSDGCATKDSLALNLSFSPQWTGVLPSVDLTMPMSYSVGLFGNAPTIGGSTDAAYKFSIGLTAVYKSRYEFAMLLTDGHQYYRTAAATAANGVPGEQVRVSGNGTGSSQNNHRWLALRFKTTF